MNLSTRMAILHRKSLFCHHWLNSISFIVKREFFPFSPTRKKFKEQNYTRFTPQQLYDVVVDVDRYYQFLPHCIESRVIFRSDKRMEADVVVGVSHLVTEKYRSIIHLDAPHRIRIYSLNSKILKHLESEWRFEPVATNLTLITFRVEYEFYSRFHDNIMNLFVDDFTRKTIRAFMERARLIYSKSQGANNNAILDDDSSFYP